MSSFVGGALKLKGLQVGAPVVRAMPSVSILSKSKKIDKKKSKSKKDKDKRHKKHRKDKKHKKRNRSGSSSSEKYEEKPAAAEIKESDAVNHEEAKEDEEEP